jgi:hypothetical protein
MNSALEFWTSPEGTMDTAWFVENISPLPFVVGLVLCVGGWTLYWGGLNFLGAIVGVVFGLGIGAAGLFLFAPPKEYGPLHLFVLPIAAVVGLYLGTRFFRALHKVFFFFIGALLGAVLWGADETTLLNLASVPALGDSMRIVVHLVVSCVCGIAMVLLSRYCIVIIASLAGTALLLTSIMNEKVHILFIPLFLTSVAIQTGFVRALGLGVARKSDEKENEED